MILNHFGKFSTILLLKLLTGLLLFLLFVNIELEFLGTHFSIPFLESVFFLRFYLYLALLFVVLITLFSLTKAFLTGDGKHFSIGEMVVLSLLNS